MQLPQASVYELFPTTNMWTFIQLDTRNGQLWQVQYDVKGENRMRTVLNAESLSGTEAPFEGRFTLYPTQNMYTFILLDRAFGRTWQVQWNFDEEYRLVVPIQ